MLGLCYTFSLSLFQHLLIQWQTNLDILQQNAPTSHVLVSHQFLCMFSLLV